MDAAARRELIEGLCSFEGRWPGTDAERRAAGWLSARIRALGRSADLEPIWLHPEYPLVMALHVALVVAGSLLALALPPVGFALVLFACASLYLDQSTRLYLLRRLFFRRASQCVVSPGPRPGAGARLLLTAHYDAARTGWVFGERSTRLAHRLPPGARVLAGPIRLFFWGGFVPLLVISGLRLAGIEAQAVSAAQLVPTVLLLVTFVLLVDIALSDVVPGAYDNASGVAAVLSAAAALDADPPENLDVWLVLPGGEEANAEGFAAWLDAHRRDPEREHTWIVNVDSVSAGDVHYLTSEGAIVSYPMDRRLVELAEAVAAADREGDDRYRAQPVRIPFHSDALPARVRGYRAISLLGLEDGVNPGYYHTHDDTPDKVDDDALERAVGFTVDLVRALDRDLGRAAHAR